MLISIFGIGFLVFYNWRSSALATTELIAEDLNDRIYKQIEFVISVPEHINSSIHVIFEKGILDVADEELRDKFFASVLKTHEQIYSLSYGTADGDYFGARRNENDDIEIKKSNNDTNGQLWFLSTKEDFTADKIVGNVGSNDPRKQVWYSAAEKAGRPIFSPVYKHFSISDLAICNSWPIYNEEGRLQGVLGARILLHDIDRFLQEIVNKYDGYAVIYEKNSNALVANSLGATNFTVFSNGAIERRIIKDPLELLPEEVQDEKLYVNTKEIKRDGLEWVVFSAIPENLLIAPVVQSLNLVVFITVILLLLAIFLYMLFISKLLQPMNNLLEFSTALSSGDLTKRVKIVRNDEIGKISDSFNQLADRLQNLINNLEDAVKERTDQLQIILDSTADGIFGLDLNGNCVFCNTSCIKMLGYKSQEDLIGKNVYKLVHHSLADGTPVPFAECKIAKSIKEGVGYSADNELFRRADGTCFNVEYHSFPKIKDGKIIGSVVTFMDITDRKEKEEKINYLSRHDALTGLYNRRSFEEYRKNLDVSKHLPLSVIFADINGLKMTNDIFGHARGDELIKKSAVILKESCRESDFVARIGGDEFIILLPRTSLKKARKVLERIKARFADARVEAVKCSISLGVDTKRFPDQSLDTVITNAENAMYKDKSLSRKQVNMDIIDSIINTLHAKSIKEKEHSIAVSMLCGEIGAALNLSELEINKLKRAGYLHDIGKIVLSEKLLNNEELTEEETEEMKQHSVAGYRILNLFDDTLDLVEYVYSHHECWDGSGYPRGLKGEQIPLIARIIAVAETFERVLNCTDIPEGERKNKALEIIIEGAGSKFDPDIAQLFVKIMSE